MEAAGLGIGIAGLLGLFSACLEAIDKVKAYKSFTTDADALNVQCDNHRLRLEYWGRNVGLANGQLSADYYQRLDDDKTRSSVADLLRIIHSVLGSDGGSKQTGRGITGLLKNTTLGATANHPRTRQGAAESKTRKLTWALGGKGDRTVQVKLLGDLVQQLHNVVPPERTGSTHPTPDISSHEALRGTDALGKAQTPGTQSELGSLLAEFRQALAQEEAETRREIHAWVQGQRSPNERYEDSRSKRLSGTCDWILTRPAYIRWSAPELPIRGSAVRLDAKGS
ncbi:prion-inhibition and propagation-domain-containing protein [Plectosphaerella cucumerina]|uniref:Prion-inhibition and propagation-domain-containing protein n=1 Tax=Plectosphaerella cucumerina TaxID=40658 RepID=A0A8K0TTG0_9PEZI|nr:prion-inhibition and propagation-domain-containing protein [Plectosphaerella cucumerina]